MFSIENQKQFKIAVAFTVVFLCMVFLPLFAIAHFNYPCTDDFAYGSALYTEISNNSGIKAALHGAWEEAVQYYRTWQGRYFDDVSSAFFVGIAVPKYYFMSAYLTLILFLGAGIYFLRTVTYRICGWNSGISWIVSMLIVSMQILYVPYPSEAFYWHVGATGYTLTYALLLLLVTVLRLFYLSGSRKKKAIYGVLSILFAFMIGGSNYSTGLLTAEILTLALLWMLLRKKKCRFLGVVTIEYLICFVYFNALAPGNHSRMGAVKSLGVVGSILASFKQGTRYLREWFQLPVILLLVLILLLGAHQIVKMKFSFKSPGLVTALSFGLFCSQMTPPFFAGATQGPGRLINLIYFSYFFLLAGNLLYWIGWIAGKSEKFRQFFLKEPRVLSLLIAFFVLWIGVLKISGLQSTSSSSAFLSLAKGEARTYLKENEARWEIYEDDTVQDVVVSDFSVKPRVLYHDDIVEDAGDWRNSAVATFFDKNSVRLEP